MEDLSQLFDRSSMDWGVVIRDPKADMVLFEHRGERVLKTASVGKLALLAFAGNALLETPGTAATRLDRRNTAPIGDSGIWQHLDVDELCIADIVRLVFIASDNLATNVLLDYFHLDRVRSFRAELGLECTDLRDSVRDVRGPDDAESLSHGSAAELSEFMARIVQGRLVSPALCRWFRQGLSRGMDLTMVPFPFALDPLARPGALARDIAMVANKTGTDTGIRADAGMVRLGSRELAYAALCNYDPSHTADMEVLMIMHRIGEAIRAACCGES